MDLKHFVVTALVVAAGVIAAKIVQGMFLGGTASTSTTGQ